MKKNDTKSIVYADTSYLNRMPWTERADWEKLLSHAKLCLANLDLQPQLEVHVSEIALNEYQTQFVDELNAEIEKVKKSLTTLQEQWQRNSITNDLDYPFPRGGVSFPTEVEIRSAADNFIQNLLNSGVKKIGVKEHHQSEVWKKYFNWLPPFNMPTIIERAMRSFRKNRRSHIPDAWIVEAAIDAANNGYSMFCLCKDGRLGTTLDYHGHKVFEKAEEILKILFPPEIDVSPVQHPTAVEVVDDQETPLGRLLVKALNPVIRDIYIYLLGFTVALDTPEHETLIDAVVSRGFNRELVKACAVTLSDTNKPYIKDTGSHYIIGDKDVCEAAAERLTSEIIDLLGQTL